MINEEEDKIDFENLSKRIQKSFEKLLPDKSIYEL